MNFRKLIVLTASMLSIFYSFTQVNSYFENNPQWKLIKWYSISGMDCEGPQEEFNYTVNGDTIISGILYKKIYKKGIYSSLGPNCEVLSSGFFTQNLPALFLRSEGKKMYIYDTFFNIDSLLYDFNLSVGDTLVDSYTHGEGHVGYPMTVFSVDSILTPNGYMKKFGLSLNGSSNISDTLFEGAGSTGGLEDPIYQLFLSGYHALTCYSLNDYSYFANEGGSCNMSVGIAENKMNTTISIFPNPFNEKVEFQLNESIQNAVLTIFDQKGLIVRSIEFSGENYTLERKGLRSGLYYYNLQSTDKMVATGKLIVLD